MTACVHVCVWGSLSAPLSVAIRINVMGLSKRSLEIQKKSILIFLLRQKGVELISLENKKSVSADHGGDVDDEDVDDDDDDNDDNGNSTMIVFIMMIKLMVTTANPLSLYLYLSHSLILSPSLSFYPSLFLLYFFLSVSLSFFLSLWFPPCLSLSLPPTFSPTHNSLRKAPFS